MKGRLQDKVAIVTGSTGGIGRVAAESFAHEGARVVVTGRRAEQAGQVADRICEAGGEAIACPGDLAVEADAERLVAAAMDRFGRLDVLVNNAALSDMGKIVNDTTVVAIDLDLWNEIFAVNVTGPALVCKYAVPCLQEAGGGSIVMTSSVIAQTGVNTTLASTVTKAALESLGRHIASAFGPSGIRCNSLALGAIGSESYEQNLPEAVRAIIESSVPLGRRGSLEEVAAAMVFLASDESSYLNGEVLRLDGGLMGHMPYDSQLAEFFRRAT